MPNTKNAIGFPTSNGEFEEMATTAPKVNENASNIPYDNSQSGLTATDVQDAIDEINNDLSELRGNIKGTNVSIKTLGTSSEYTCLTDGYLYLESGLSGISAVNIKDANSTVFQTAVVRNGNTSFTFVRKGMKLQLSGASTETYEALFMPLLNN